MAIPKLLSYKSGYPNWEEDCYEICGHQLKILRMIGSDLQFSSVIWTAGLVLCKYFENEKMDFTGKKVIELGSGTGIVGIVAALLGGNVTLTDRPRVLPQIQTNLNNNIPASIIHRSNVTALCWGVNHYDFPSDYDYIIGSDIVYQVDSYKSLIETLKALSNPNTVIFISSKMWLTTPAFYNTIITIDFNTEIVCSDDRVNVFVYKITKKCPASDLQNRN